VDDGGVAVLPRASGGDDEMRQVMASPMVVAAASIASWWHVEAWPESAASADLAGENPATRGVNSFHGWTR
jgi:hypothetical protein